MSEIIDTRYQKIRRNKEELIEHLNNFNLDVDVAILRDFGLENA